MLVNDLLLKESVDFKQETEHRMCKEMRDHDFPFFLLGRDFIEMLDHTDSLSDFSLSEEIGIPFPSFILLFPKGSLVLPIRGGFDVQRIQITGWNEHGVDGNTFIMSCSPHSDAIHQGKVAKVFCAYVNIGSDGTLIHNDPESVEFYHSDHEESEEELKLAIQSHIKIASLMMKILTALAAEPELLESGFTENVRPAKRGRPRLEFRQPKWIGKRVRFDRESDLRGDGHTCMHWRRGHFRRQPFGKGRTQNKIIFIRPVLVNSEHENK